MACIDFYPEDYLNEISTAALEAELQRRGPSLPEPPDMSIADDLRDAWDERDEARFERALRVLESTPRELAARAALAATRYREWLAQAQASFPMALQ